MFKNQIIKKSVNQLGLRMLGRFGSRPSTLIERLFGKRCRKYLISPKACIWGSSLVHIAQEYSCALASCYRMTRVCRCSMREGLLPFPSFFSTLEEESTVFHFQSPNIRQWQNKGKAEPESGLLVLISLLHSPQGKDTDEQQMWG